MKIRNHLNPIGANHAIGVKASQHIAGGGVQAEIAGGNQPLLVVLVQQFDRRLGMFGNEPLHDCAGVIR